MATSSASTSRSSGALGSKGVRSADPPQRLVGEVRALRRALRPIEELLDE